MRLGFGDPCLQKERKTRLVEPPRGLHSNEDVLLLQLRLGDMCTLIHRVSTVPAAAVGSRLLCVVVRGGSLLYGAVERTG